MHRRRRRRRRLNSQRRRRRHEGHHILIAYTGCLSRFPGLIFHCGCCFVVAHLCAADLHVRCVLDFFF